MYHNFSYWSKTVHYCFYLCSIQIISKGMTYLFWLQRPTSSFAPSAPPFHVPTPPQVPAYITMPPPSPAHPTAYPPPTPTPYASFQSPYPSYPPSSGTYQTSMYSSPYPSGYPPTSYPPPPSAYPPNPYPPPPQASPFYPPGKYMSNPQMFYFMKSQWNQNLVCLCIVVQVLTPEFIPHLSIEVSRLALNDHFISCIESSTFF